MKIAGFEIITCPHCSQLYRERIVGSYNSFNSSHYSDGYVKGTGIPVFQSVIKCINKNCRKLFNMMEAVVIAKFDGNDPIPTEWKEAYYLPGYNISVKELEEGLTTDFCNNQKNEKKVRILLHQRYNDVFRTDRKYKFSNDEIGAFIHNIEKLIDFHKSNTSPIEKLYLAELFREKGDFNSCIQLLSEIKDENKYEKQAKEKIYSQAKMKDDKVFDFETVAIKKEYQCDNCGDNRILFDLEKMNNQLDYKHYRCRDTNTVFDSPSKIKNPIKYYALTIWQKTFKSKAPYSWIIINHDIFCPCCNKKDVEIFQPETRKCVRCDNGKYITVQWF